MNENEKIIKLAEKYFKAEDQLGPTSATMMGIHDYDGELEDLSSSGLSRMKNTCKSFRKELDEIEFDKLDSDEKIKYHILNSKIKSTERFFRETRQFERDPAYYMDIATNSIYLLLIRDFAPLEERLRSTISRLNKIPDLYESARQNIGTPPKVFTQVALDILKGADSMFDDLIPKIASKVPSLEEEVNKAAQKAKKATDEYREFLEKEVFPRSDGDFAVGSELMDEMLSESDFLDYTSEDLWKIGKRELEVCEKELDEFCRKNMDPDKTWRENYLKVKEHHPAADKVLDTYTKFLKNARDFVIKHDLVTIPENQKVISMATPEFQRAIIPFAAYHPPAPYEKDFTGYLMVTPIDPDQSQEAKEHQLKDNCFGKIQYVSLHECYPGHHLQLVYHSNLKDPVIKRMMSNVFIEGWAFYTEQLMKDYGYFDNEGHLCQLEAAYWRALRILLDVGLHTGKFDFEGALELIQSKTDWSPFIAMGELKRYTRTPTQALSYYTGKLELFKIKEEYEKKVGDRFSLKKFHEDLLNCGSMPPRLMEWKLGLREIKSPVVPVTG